MRHLEIKWRSICLPTASGIWPVLGLCEAPEPLTVLLMSTMRTTHNSHSLPGNSLDTPAASIVGSDREFSKAFWTMDDEQALVQFLLNRKAEAGDGANFKPAIWTSAACKSKWGRVSSSPCCTLLAA
jgi:hypothetical protein